MSARLPASDTLDPEVQESVDEVLRRLGITPDSERKAPSNYIKAALIIGAAIIIAVAINIYFSPYHTCVRDLGEIKSEGNPGIKCAVVIGRGR